jgi:methionine synthase I (cobalamin-dependent)
MIYDGGFGASLFHRGVELVNSSLANESNPDAVVGIHSAYLDAGADAIGTNTFVASTLHLDMAGKDGDGADRIVRLGVEHARRAVERSGRDAYIAGSIGPSPGAIEADSGDVDMGISNSAVRDALERLGNQLAECGVDFLCLETMFSANEAALAVEVLRGFGLPIAVNMTYKYTRDRRSGETVYRTDWGHSPADLLDILASGEFSRGEDLLDWVHILGTNCGAEPRRVEHTGMPYAVNGTRQLRLAMAERNISSKRLMAYPNAGLPRLDGNMRTYYDQDPEEMSSGVAELLEEGAYLVGGCCGTDPDHIRAFRALVDSRMQVARHRRS